MSLACITDSESGIEIVLLVDVTAINGKYMLACTKKLAGGINADSEQ
jgi:hypothetical protein